MIEEVNAGMVLRGKGKLPDKGEVATTRGSLDPPAADEGSQRPLPAAARAIVESAPDALVIVDRHGAMLLVNAQTERLFGYQRGELVGRPVEMLIPERFRSGHKTQRARFNAEPSRRAMHARTVELFAVRKDGVEFPCEIGLSPVETEGRIMTIAAIRDITARRDAEQEQGRLAQAQEAVRMRDEFLSVAAHELRTPLTALQLQLQSLQKSIERPDFGREQMVAKVGKAVRHLGRLNELVDQLLDVSRIVSSPLTLRPEEVDMGSLVRDVVEDFQDQARRAGCTISVDGDGHAVGVWDRFRIEQILVNLLSNAIKYGAGRPVIVEVLGTDKTVVVRVSDHGIGIQSKDIERIFGRFERGAPAAHYGGLGLGLYIARHLAESHGGQLRAQSQPGEGSTFELELPRRWRVWGG